MVESPRRWRLTIWVPLADPSSAKKFIVAIDPAVPPSGLAGAVVAIGNFDGIHRGHLAVIKRARSLAEEFNCPCAVLTFEPHPADFFRGPNTIFRLTPRDAKARALEQLGIDGMIVITFDKVLASLQAEAFAAEILVRRLKVRAVVAGYDFHFGAGRSGSPAFLEEAGKRHGFVVAIVERVPADDTADIDEAASSTAARAAFEAGDVEAAARLLGHPFAILGKVIHGQEQAGHSDFRRPIFCRTPVADCATASTPSALTWGQKPMTAWRAMAAARPSIMARRFCSFSVPFFRRSLRRDDRVSSSADSRGSEIDFGRGAHGANAAAMRDAGKRDNLRGDCHSPFTIG